MSEIREAKEEDRWAKEGQLVCAWKGDMVTLKDFGTLREREWVCDAVINAYFNMLNRAIGKTSCFMSSFLLHQGLPFQAIFGDVILEATTVIIQPLFVLFCQGQVEGSACRENSFWDLRKVNILEVLGSAVG